MISHQLTAALHELRLLPVTPATGEQPNVMDSIRVLGNFNGCLVGLVYFSGRTGWERHGEGEELLHILEGETVLTMLENGTPTTLTAHQGDLVQIPRGVWHTQQTVKPVKLLFITPAGGTEHCSAETPPGC